MISGIQPFGIRHHHRAALGTHQHLVFSLLKLLHTYRAKITASCKQCRLINQISQISTRKSRSPTCNQIRPNIITHRHFAHVHFQNLLATTNIGQTNHHLTVETPRPQQRLIKHVGTVSRGNNNDTLRSFEAIHFNQQLVQGLLTFIVTTTHARTAMTAHCIDLIDKDNTGRLLLGLLEHITHTRCADTDKHLDEIRA